MNKIHNFTSLAQSVTKVSPKSKSNYTAGLFQLFFSVPNIFFFSIMALYCMVMLNFTLT
uniref:Uncharacterized protein n=1 Tax=Arundo donax TaxID=35708 RepID=A0A0A9G642_ARUDO